MNNWKMITLIGEDQKGIVAAVTRVLETESYNLGETSMIRLASNFAMMMMARCTSNKVCSDQTLRDNLKPVLDNFELTLHIDDVKQHKKHHLIPNMSIAVHGADQAGIVADVTDALTSFGFNILDLYSDIGGKNKDTFYILHIEGCCDSTETEVHDYVMSKLGEHVKVVVSDIETLVG